MMTRFITVFLMAFSMIIQNVYASTYNFWQNFGINVDNLAKINADTTYNVFSTNSNTIFGQTSIKYEDDEFVASQGFGYRVFNDSKTFMFGANTVYDWKVIEENQYQRLSFGLEFRFPYISLSSNYYVPITKERNRLIDNKLYATGVYGGYDVELTGSIPITNTAIFNRLDISAGYYYWNADTKSSAPSGGLVPKGYDYFKSQKGITLGANLFVAYGIELFLKHDFKKSKDPAISNDDETTFGIKYTYNFDEKIRKTMYGSPANLEQYRFKKINRDYDVKLYAREAVIARNYPYLRFGANGFAESPSILLWNDDLSDVYFSMGDQTLDNTTNCKLSLNGQPTHNLIPAVGECKAGSLPLGSSLGQSSFGVVKASGFAEGNKEGTYSKVESPTYDLIILDKSAIKVVSSAPFIEGVPATVEFLFPSLKSINADFIACEVIVNNEPVLAELSDAGTIDGVPMQKCTYKFIPQTTQTNLGLKLYSTIGSLTTGDMINVTGVSKSTIVLPLEKVFASEEQKIFSTFDYISGVDTCFIKVNEKLYPAQFTKNGSLAYCYNSNFKLSDYVSNPSITQDVDITMVYNNQNIANDILVRLIPDPTASSKEPNGDFIINSTIKVDSPETLTIGFNSNFTAIPIGVDNQVVFKSCSVQIEGNSVISTIDTISGVCKFSYTPNTAGDLKISVEYNVDASAHVLKKDATLQVNSSPTVGNLAFERPNAYLDNIQNVTVQNIDNINTFTKVKCTLVDITSGNKELLTVDADLTNKTCTFGDFNPKFYGLTTGVNTLIAEVIFEEAANQTIKTLQSTLTLNTDNNITAILTVPQEIMEGQTVNAKGTLSAQPQNNIKACYVLINGAFEPDNTDPSKPKLGTVNGLVCDAQFIARNGVNTVAVRWETDFGYISTPDKTITAKIKSKITFENLVTEVLDNYSQSIIAKLNDYDGNSFKGCNISVNGTIIPSNFTIVSDVAKCTSQNLASFASNSEIIIEFINNDGSLLNNADDPQVITVINVQANYQVVTNELIKDKNNPLNSTVSDAKNIKFSSCSFVYSLENSPNESIQSGIISDQGNKYECTFSFNPNAAKDTKYNSKFRFISNVGFVDSSIINLTIIDTPVAEITAYKAVVFNDFSQNIETTITGLSSYANANNECTLLYNGTKTQYTAKTLNSPYTKCIYSNVVISNIGDGKLSSEVKLVLNNTVIISQEKDITVVQSPAITLTSPSVLISGANNTIEATVTKDNKVVFDSCSVNINNGGFHVGVITDNKCTYEYNVTTQTGQSDIIIVKFISQNSGEVSSAPITIKVSDRRVVTITQVRTPVFDNVSQTIVAEINPALESGMSITKCELKDEGSLLTDVAVIGVGSCTFNDINLISQKIHKLTTSITLNTGVVLNTLVETEVEVITKPNVAFAVPSALIKTTTTELTALVENTNAQFNACSIKIGNDDYINAVLNDNKCTYNYTTPSSASGNIEFTFRFISNISGVVDSLKETTPVVEKPTVNINPLPVVLDNQKLIIAAEVQNLDTSNISVTNCALLDSGTVIVVTQLPKNNTTCEFFSPNGKTFNLGVHNLSVEVTLSNGVNIASNTQTLEVVANPTVSLKETSALIEGISMPVEASVSIPSGIVFDSCKMEFEGSEVNAVFNNNKCSFDYTTPSPHKGSVNLKVIFISNNGGTVQKDFSITTIAYPNVVITGLVTPVFDNNMQNIEVNVDIPTGITPEITITACYIKDNTNQLFSNATINGKKCTFTDKIFSEGNYNLIAKVDLSNGVSVESLQAKELQSFAMPTISFNPPDALVSKKETEITSKIQSPNAIEFNQCYVYQNGREIIGILSKVSDGYSCSKQITPISSSGNVEEVYFQYISYISGDVSMVKVDIPVVDTPIVLLEKVINPIFVNKEQTLKLKIDNLSSGITVKSCSLKGDSTIWGAVEGTIGDTFRLCKFDNVSFSLAKDNSLVFEVLLTTNVTVNYDFVVSSVNAPNVSFIAPESIIKGEKINLKAVVTSINGVSYNSCSIIINKAAPIAGILSTDECSYEYTSNSTAGTKDKFQFVFVSEAGETSSAEGESAVVNKPIVTIKSPVSNLVIFNNFDLLVESEVTDISAPLEITECILKDNGVVKFRTSPIAQKCLFNASNYTEGSHYLTVDVVLNNGFIVTSDSILLNVATKPLIDVKKPTAFIKNIATEVSAVVTPINGVVFNSCNLLDADGNYTIVGTFDAISGKCSYDYTISSNISTYKIGFEFISDNSGVVISSNFEIPVVEEPLVTITIAEPLVFPDKKQTIIATIDNLSNEVTSSKCDLLVDSNTISGISYGYNQCIFIEQSFLEGNYLLKAKVTFSNGAVVESSVAELKSVTKPVPTFEGSKVLIVGHSVSLTTKISSNNNVMFDSCYLTIGGNKVLGTITGSYPNYTCGFTYIPTNAGNDIETKVGFISDKSGYTESPKFELDFVNMPLVTIGSTLSPVFTDKSQSIVANISNLDSLLNIVNSGCKLLNNGVQFAQTNYANGKCQFDNIIFSNVGDNRLNIEVDFDNNSNFVSSVFLVKSIDKPATQFTPPTGLSVGVATELRSMISNISGGAIFSSCVVSINDVSYSSINVNFESGTNTCIYSHTPINEVNSYDKIKFKFISSISGEVETEAKSIRIIGEALVNLIVPSLYVFNNKAQDIVAVVSGNSLNVTECNLMDGVSKIATVSATSITASTLQCKFNAVTFGTIGSHALKVSVMNGSTQVDSSIINVSSYNIPDTYLLNPTLMVKGVESEIIIATNPSLNGVIYNSCKVVVNVSEITGVVSDSQCKIKYTASVANDSLTIRGNFVSDASGIVNGRDLTLNVLDVPQVTINQFVTPVFEDVAQTISATISNKDINLTIAKCELINNAQVVNTGVVNGNNCDFAGMKFLHGNNALTVKAYFNSGANEVAIVVSSSATLVSEVKPAVVFNPPLALTSGIDNKLQAKATLDASSTIVINSCQIRIDNGSYLNATLSASSNTYTCDYIVKPDVGLYSEKFTFKFISNKSGELLSDEKTIKIVGLPLVTINPFLTPIFNDKVQNISSLLNNLDSSLSIAVCKLKYELSEITGVVSGDGCRFDNLKFLTGNYKLVVEVELSNGVIVSSIEYALQSLDLPGISVDKVVVLILGNTNKLTASVEAAANVSFETCEIKINNIWTPSTINSVGTKYNCAALLQPTVAVGNNEIIEFRFTSYKSGSVSSGNVSIPVVDLPSVLIRNINTPVLQGSSQNISVSVSNLSSYLSITQCNLRYSEQNVLPSTSIADGTCEFALNSDILQSGANIISAEVILSNNSTLKSSSMVLSVYANKPVITINAPDVLIENITSTLGATIMDLAGISYDSCQIKVGTGVFENASLGINKLTCSIDHKVLTLVGGIESIQFKFISNKAGEVISTVKDIPVIALPTAAFISTNATVFNDKSIAISAQILSLDARLSITNCILKNGSVVITTTTATANICSFANMTFANGQYSLVTNFVLSNGAVVSSNLLSLSSIVKPLTEFNPPAGLTIGISNTLSAKVLDVPSGIVFDTCQIKYNNDEFILIGNIKATNTCEVKYIPIKLLGEKESFVFRFVSNSTGFVDTLSKSVPVIDVSRPLITSILSSVFSDTKQLITVSTQLSAGITITKCALLDNGIELANVAVISGGVCTFADVTFAAGEHDVKAVIELNNGARVESLLTSKLLSYLKPLVSFIPPVALVANAQTELSANFVAPKDIIINSCEIKIDNNSYTSSGTILSGIAPNYKCTYRATPTAAPEATQNYTFRFISNGIGEVLSNTKGIKISKILGVNISSIQKTVFITTTQKVVAEVMNLDSPLSIVKCELKNSLLNDVLLLSGIVNGEECNFYGLKLPLLGIYGVKAVVTLNTGVVLSSDVVNVSVLSLPIISFDAPKLLVEETPNELQAVPVTITKIMRSGVVPTSCQISTNGGAYQDEPAILDINTGACLYTHTPTVGAGGTEDFTFKFIFNCSDTGDFVDEIISDTKKVKVVPLPTISFREFNKLVFVNNPIDIKLDVARETGEVYVKDCRLQNGSEIISVGYISTITTGVECIFEDVSPKVGNYNLKAVAKLSSNAEVKTDIVEFKVIDFSEILPDIKPLIRGVETTIKSVIENTKNVSYIGCAIKIGDGDYVSANLSGLECSRTYQSQETGDNIIIGFRYISYSGVVELSEVNYPLLDRPEIIFGNFPSKVFVDKNVDIKILSPKNIGTLEVDSCNLIFDSKNHSASYDKSLGYCEFKGLTFTLGETIIAGNVKYNNGVELKVPSISIVGIQKPEAIFNPKENLFVESQSKLVSNINTNPDNIEFDSCYIRKSGEDFSEAKLSSVSGKYSCEYNITPSKNDVGTKTFIVKFISNDTGEVLSNISNILIVDPEISIGGADTLVFSDKEQTIYAVLSGLSNIKITSCKFVDELTDVEIAGVSSKQICSNDKFMLPVGMYSISAEFTLEDGTLIKSSNNENLNIEIVKKPIASFVTKDPLIIGAYNNLKSNLAGVRNDIVFNECYLLVSNNTIIKAELTDNDNLCQVSYKSAVTSESYEELQFVYVSAISGRVYTNKERFEVIAGPKVKMLDVTTPVFVTKTQTIKANILELNNMNIAKCVLYNDNDVLDIFYINGPAEQCVFENKSFVEGMYAIRVAVILQNQAIVYSDQKILVVKAIPEIVFNGHSLVNLKTSILNSNVRVSDDIKFNRCKVAVNNNSYIDANYSDDGVCRIEYAPQNELNANFKVKYESDVSGEIESHEFVVDVVNPKFEFSNYMTPVDVTTKQDINLTIKDIGNLSLKNCKLLNVDTNEIIKESYDIFVYAGEISCSFKDLILKEGTHKIKAAGTYISEVNFDTDSQYITIEVINNDIEAVIISPADNSLLGGIEYNFIASINKSTAVTVESCGMRLTKENKYIEGIYDEKSECIVSYNLGFVLGSKTIDVKMEFSIVGETGEKKVIYTPTRSYKVIL